MIKNTHRKIVVIFSPDSQNDLIKIASLQSISNQHQQSAIGDSQSETLVQLARNFGKDANIKAGIDHIDINSIDAVIVVLAEMPSDDVIEKMIEAYNAGNDIVFAKPTNSNQANCILLDKKVIKIIRQISEPKPNIQLLAEWVGFRKKTIRAKTRQPITKKLKHILSGIFDNPANITLVLAYLAIVIAIISIFGWITSIFSFPIFWIGIICAIVLGAITLIGDYVRRAYKQSLNRPLYIIREKINF